ncbi:hypothetical protein [Denitromonas ohlonensis]|jgi:hypothetical protein|uniref:Uncharacterized protein n=2 Tax=Denitromonas TaxID=139331 RepID=A0A557SL76_9RHOO|nr:hypothetical protein [Denitromonas ohlonensis]TVO67909.1 hypothetical protein FHP90_04835 [Denitromonas ohlonensis]TVO78186.1 hypothetical protein FHP89_06825 [Denitromonas ohlonensis]
MTEARPKSPPVLASLMIVIGALCTIFGLALMAGLGADWHPLLATDGAGIVMLVSGIALAGSGAFPLVFARLAAGDDTQ